MHLAVNGADCTALRAMDLPVEIPDSDLEWLSSVSSEDSYTDLSGLTCGLTPVTSCDTTELVWLLAA